MSVVYIIRPRSNVHLDLSDPSLGLTERGGSVDGCRLTVEAARSFYFKTLVSLNADGHAVTQHGVAHDGRRYCRRQREESGNRALQQLGVSGEEIDAICRHPSV